MDWIDELENIRNEDEKKQKDKGLDLSILGRQSSATRILKAVDAHNTLRKVRSVLLGNKGRIDFFDSAVQYDNCVGLIWQGPVSKARNPDEDDPTPYNFILVGVKGREVLVNGKKLRANTPEDLKEAVVEAAKKPGVQKK